MKKLILPLLIAIIALSSCDKVTNPIPDTLVNTAGINWDDSLYTESNPAVRRIMIEEFTGHLCTYCPDGAREIKRLDSIYGSQLVPMSIHAGAFADVPAGGAGFDANGDLIMDFTTDFSVAAGEEYNTTYGVSAYPAGTISRLNNANITGLSQWEVDINTIKNDVPKVSIGLSTLYDDSTRTAKAVVNTQWLSTVSGSFNLQIYMIEDSITAWQLDNGVYIENYIHRHVFRAVLNGAWGSSIPSSNLGDSNTQEFAITLPSNWDKNKCYIIAHVYQAAPVYEILQVEELHIVNNP